MVKLKKQFYTKENTIEIAQALLGKKLCSNIDGKYCSGIICETEAYCGKEDRGCHAYHGRYTDRTKIMYEDGGVVYVYLCYGIHFLFNVITNAEQEPHAVLIRAVEPLEGIAWMMKRCGTGKMHAGLAAGPGLVSKCFGFTTKHTGTSLLNNKIWIEEYQDIAEDDILKSARVGMNFEGEYKLIPWRFRIKNSIFTSKAK